MVAGKCAACAAPLPETTDATGNTMCSYCGTPVASPVQAALNADVRVIAEDARARIATREARVARQHAKEQAIRKEREDAPTTALGGCLVLVTVVLGLIGCFAVASEGQNLGWSVGQIILAVMAILFGLPLLAVFVLLWVRRRL
jgi:hypothetical protein